MITKIKLQNAGSYKETPAILETDKKINFVYGLNGTGKTILSNYLQDMNNKFFTDCSIDGYNNEKILVYNQKFVENNFYEREQLKGIFTLSEENKDIQKEIDKLEDLLKKVNEKLVEDRERLQGLETRQESCSKTARDKIWEIKEKYTGGDRVLEFCLKGLMGNKTKLFEHIKGVSKPSEKPHETIEQLEEKARRISGGQTQIELLKEINLSKIKNIENDPIFKEVIVGNEVSPVADLIKKLNNSDWVGEGLKYLPNKLTEDAEKCPFCQEKTITKELAGKIRNYFDETFQSKKDELQRLLSNYQESLDTLLSEEQYLGDNLVAEKKSEFKHLYFVLRKSLEKNLQKINSKIESPNREVKMDSTVEKLNSFNEFIRDINEKINIQNQEIQNREETKNKIEEIFWEIMRCDYDGDISRWEEEYNDIEKEINKVNTDIGKLIEEKSGYENSIMEKQKNTVNIDKSMENIKRSLLDLGIVDFSIEKYEGNFYKLVRNGGNQNDFNTLSEGEKTILTFLYFLELCEGKEERDERKIEKIIIVDDPVSSLSHMYVFNISTLIKHRFFLDKKINETYKKIFILTHSLYFLHGLIHRRQSKSDKSDKKFFRITKGENGSQIKEMEKDEIMNEYESYWQVIKDYEKEERTVYLLANCMRNILEYFFAFIDKEGLSKALKKLDEPRFTPFLRYMDRESHSDHSNIYDFKEMNVSIFRDAFKEVFEKSGNINHYNKYMSINQK